MSTQPGKITRILSTVARFLLGLPLVVFGLNQFLNFIPQPEVEMPEKALTFVAALMDSGYMMPLIAITQLFTGVCLLTNRFVALAMVVFFPFMVNSIAFHIYLEPSGLPMACAFLFLNLYLAWVHRAAYRPMLTAKA